MIGLVFETIYLVSRLAFLLDMLHIIISSFQGSVQISEKEKEDVVVCSYDEPGCLKKFFRFSCNANACKLQN